MTKYEKDPDIVRWGLHQLLGDLSISDYCGTATHNNADIQDGEYVRENNFSTDHAAMEYLRESNFAPDHAAMENDEVIAHSLQEEYSHVAVAEASGHPPSDEEHLQASVLAHAWFGPPMSNPYSGNENGHEMADDTEHPISCSSSEEKLYEGEVPIELTDEYASLDGEVGKRLNNMVPVPHVPKINGEIPSVDEATSDHQRLLDRLRLYDLVELKVQGDGNCQFRALSDQFYRTPEHHKFVREQVVNQLKTDPETYEGYVPMAYSDYLKKMSKSGEWGDHVTLQAAADTYGVKIFVLTSFKDTCYIEILPNVQKSKRVIFLSFWAEVHYNSIYPEGDFPILETKKKKRWWNFGK